MIALFNLQCRQSTSSFPHLFPLSCGVDVSYEMPPSSSVLSVLPGQFSLRQVVPDAIQPPPLWSSSPSFPRHLHRHHSLAYVFVFSSQYVPIPLQPTFLYFLGYFSHLRCPSNCRQYIDKKQTWKPNFIWLHRQIMRMSQPGEKGPW